MPPPPVAVGASSFSASCFAARALGPWVDDEERGIPRAVFGLRPKVNALGVSLATVVALATLSLAGAARADGPYEGQWREGPMSIQVTVQSWGGDCGPRPQATSTGGGGVFRVSQEGDQLTFHLRSERTTRQCWSENRAVRRVSSSYQAGTWRIVCRTPADDSRGETGTYTIQAVGSDRLQFRDVSAYDWQLNESRCLATITTSQTFTRVGGSTPPPVATPSEPTPAPRCTPGPATRVLLRPSEAAVPPGGEQCFTTRVVDASGCAVRTRVTLALGEGEPGRIEGTCYRAADAGATVHVIAAAGELRDRATITVRTMDLSDLIARRTETGSVGSGAPEEDATTQTAARVSAHETSQGPSLVWPGVALGLALLLVLSAVVLLRRRETGRKRSIAGLPGVDIADLGRPSDPSEPGRLEAGAADGPAAAPAGDDLICPTCRRGYPPGSVRCAHDDTQLMPYKDFAAGKRPDGAAAEHACPVCGKRYPSTVKFCGEDGATLEALDE